MHEELCPFCGTLREMDLTGYRTVGFDHEGNEDNTFTVVARCRYCGLLVRTEDVKEEEFDVV